MIPSQLYSRILPWVPGCPEPTVDQAVMDSVIEFCDRTQIDVRVDEQIELQEGVSDYEVFGDDDVEQDLVRGVYGPNGEITSVTPARLQDLLPDWQTGESTIPVYYGTWFTPGSITFWPRPNQTGVLVRVASSWKPALEATSFPDSFGRQYFQTLVEGAKAKLMSMPERKWTNLQLAGVHQMKYDAGIADARAVALHGRSAGTLVARPQAFGR